MFPQQYYQGPNVVPMMQRKHRTVNDIIPGIIPGVLGIIQAFLSIVIIILEIISIYYDAGRGTIYAGLWCSAIFFVTWISMLCYLCCRKSVRCVAYLVVQNIINLIFVIILLVITSRFVENPCLCYGVLCHIPYWDDFSESDDDDDRIYSCDSRTFRKLPVLKGVLACAVLMLVCNIIFIGMYLIVSIRLRAKARYNIHTPDVMYQQQSTAVQWTEPPSYHPSTMAYSPYRNQESDPIPNRQATSEWPSAPPPSYEMSEKF